MGVLTCNKGSEVFFERMVEGVGLGLKLFVKSFYLCLKRASKHLSSSFWVCVCKYICARKREGKERSEGGREQADMHREAGRLSWTCRVPATKGARSCSQRTDFCAIELHQFRIQSGNEAYTSYFSRANWIWKGKKGISQIGREGSCRTRLCPSGWGWGSWNLDVWRRLGLEPLRRKCSPWGEGSGG